MGETYPRAYSDYVLLERLGSGGMSEVDLARKVVDDKSYVRFAVIKRIKADRAADASFVRMFKDEARITSELHHEKIGAVYDFGKVGDEYFLAIEYVAGIDVRYLVNVLRERGQRVPIKVALRIVADVLDALDYAHTKKDTFGRKMGIVHRDVNPRNVMISIRGEVKLIDFGVAKATDRLERTRTDHVKGKFSYMAPEQISGLTVDHRADLYAVGLTLHELLTGASPFFGLNQVQILHRMVSGRVPDMPEVPELTNAASLERVHHKALAHSPSERYASAAEMAVELRRVAEQVGGLPTDDQMAAFLVAVDPELTSRLQRKMEAYALVEVTETGEITTNEAEIKLREVPLPEVHGTIAEVDSLTVTRTGMLAGSFLIVAIVSAMLAAAVVTFVLLGAFVMFGPGLTTTVVEAPPEVTPTAPVAAPEPDPEPVPQPATVVPAAPVDAAAPEPVRPRPRPRPRPAPEPEPEPEVVVEPAPEPVPQPAPPPDPEPAVQPEPVPVATGYLQVNARGDLPQTVRVDGVPVGSTPLKKYAVSVGAHTIEVAGFTCQPKTAVVQKSQVVNVVCQ